MADTKCVRISGEMVKSPEIDQVRKIGSQRVNFLCGNSRLLTARGHIYENILFLLLIRLDISHTKHGTNRS